MSVNVLVVDDSDVIRSMILKTLRIAEVPVASAFEASNGREALSILEDNWVDVVLADINMPVMDGMEMVDRMQGSADLANIPVIIVSTDGNASRIEDLRAKGVAAYMRKPFTPEMLRDVVSGVTSDWTRADYASMVEQVFSNVIERFAFMYAEPAEKDQVPAPAEERLLARMTFTGGVEGAMAVAAPLSLCEEMAANILGGELDPHELRMMHADALGELLNMACGHVATLLDAECATDLAPPVVAALSAEDWDRLLTTPHTFGFAVEGRPTLVSLSVRPPR